MMTRILIFFLALLPLAGCGLREREAKLDAKEQAQRLREQQLDARELTLQQRELELEEKIHALDSPARDTLMIYEPKLIGKWSVRMACTETSCPGSAVGDTKSETWEFSYEGNFLVAKAMVKNDVVRVYTGKSTATGIQLAEAVPVASPNAATITVSLTPKENNTMEGTREILRENECRILYSLQLTKQ